MSRITSLSWTHNYRCPQVGRCGAFNVMTPIIEKVVLDKTRNSPSVSAASRFRSPNPCNPFDPATLSALLSFLPAKNSHHEMKEVKSNHLEVMQKFVNVEKKRGREDSPRSTSIDQMMLDVLLGNSIFRIIDGLGEGGLGAVFRIREVADGNKTFGEDKFPFTALKVVYLERICFDSLRQPYQSVSLLLLRAFRVRNSAPITPKIWEGFNSEAGTVGNSTSRCHVIVVVCSGTKMTPLSLNTPPRELLP
jgi:hypothetical protein